MPTDGRRLDWYTISSPCEPNGSGELIKLDRSERLCDKCSAGAVEDEQHFLIECIQK